MQIEARQQGASVLIKIPLNNFPNVSRYRQIDVYRLAEAANTTQVLSEDEFATRSTLIGSIELFPAQSSANVANFEDAVSLTPGAVRLRYAVRFVNQEGQKSSFSNFALFEITSNVSQSPTELNAELLPSSINLNWQAPRKNLDNSIPPNLAGYNVYRRFENKTIRLNSNLLTEVNFVDRVFQFGNEYEYFVRAVSTAVNGANVESDNSNTFKIIARDVFAPAAPEGLTVAAAPGRLSLFFAANSETDVKGYIIYRSRDENLAKDKWERINQEPINATTFQDERVEPGIRYFYYLRAIDNFGNLSESSEVISEIAPK